MHQIAFQHPFFNDIRHSYKAKARAQALQAPGHKRALQLLQQQRRAREDRLRKLVGEVLTKDEEKKYDDQAAQQQKNNKKKGEGEEEEEGKTEDMADQQPKEDADIPHALLPSSLGVCLPDPEIQGLDDLCPLDGGRAKQDQVVEEDENNSEILPISTSALPNNTSSGSNATTTTTTTTAAPTAPAPLPAANSTLAQRLKQGAQGPKPRADPLQRPTASTAHRQHAGDFRRY